MSYFYSINASFDDMNFHPVINSALKRHVIPLSRARTRHAPQKRRLVLNRASSHPVSYGVSPFAVSLCLRALVAQAVEGGGSRATRPCSVPNCQENSDTDLLCKNQPFVYQRQCRTFHVIPRILAHRQCIQFALRNIVRLLFILFIIIQ